jgi:hypothetical protein
MNTKYRKIIDDDTYYINIKLCHPEIDIYLSTYWTIGFYNVKRLVKTSVLGLFMEGN